MLASAMFETHVKSLDRVGKGTYGNEVDATFAIVAESFECYAARRFNFGASVYKFYSFFRALRGEVVEHDAVHSGFESLKYFFAEFTAWGIPPAKST